MKKVEKKEGFGAKEIIGIGAGIAALSAAAYVFFGPEGKKNRKVVHGWAIKMKGEIIEKLENAKELTEPVYHQIIDNVHAKYAKLKNVDREELTKVIGEVKKHWKAIKKETINKKPKTAPKKKVEKK